MRDSAGAGRFPWLVSPGADALSARILVIRFSQVKRYFYNNGRNGRKLDVLRANTGENLSVWAVFECFWLDEI
jgi:hypothetical protein